MVRDENDRTQLKYESEHLEREYPQEEYVPLEVKRGSCVMIHGLVDHQSGLNESDKGRPIYTFHLLDLHNKKWSEKNWLQETADYKFPNLYDVQV